MFRVEDLLVNDRFRKYVLNPNQGDQFFWDEWKTRERKIIWPLKKPGLLY